MTEELSWDIGSCTFLRVIDAKHTSHDAQLVGFDELLMRSICPQSESSPAPLASAGGVSCRAKHIQRKENILMWRETHSKMITATMMAMRTSAPMTTPTIRPTETGGGGWG